MDLGQFDGPPGRNVRHQGVAASGNVPGARNNAVSWIDAAGNFWLFGGLGVVGAAHAYWNDLWRFER